ncbi:unnamed protein product [Porites evermanni]|uniref:Uncharacterized protein n=1 Tax=Porites evermanni TaxID=104178 RepID=A0ABN8RAU3_9CNID|nr:unnamed protein product [Porites evermanni]
MLSPLPGRDPLWFDFRNRPMKLRILCGRLVEDGFVFTYDRIKTTCAGKCANSSSTSLDVVRVLVKFAPGATGNEAESTKRSVTLRHDGSKIPESQ